MTLIAPRIGPALARAREQRQVRWRQLALLAGRGSIRCLEADGTGHEASRQACRPFRPGALAPWQSALLEAVGLGGAAAHFPSAALIRTGELGEPAAGFWMHAQPLYFAAGMQHLSAMLLCEHNRLLPAERAALMPSLAAHLQSSDFELLGRQESDSEWLVRGAHAWQFMSVSPEHAVSMPLDEAMPQGRDAAMLRRLMTELQMLLHEHPVNAQRQARGALPVNALWLHGEGVLDLDSLPRRTALPLAFGRDAYLRGLYRLYGLTVAPAPMDAASLPAPSKAGAVVVVDTDDLDTLESAWLAPLAAALVPGGISRLELVLDRWRILVGRGARHALWRRPLAAEQWPTC
ncbi:hypothetical protein [Steroidobacter denitrificans]|uniref:hypothetical protein n=1 Tax=Steroidobacter denitrificans TaxID=465721 RepID=UPI001AEF8F9E|nr:hypothetical protein [Steroidobacter denitrificans]